MAASGSSEIRTETEMTSYARHCHPACVACRNTDEGGLGLRFRGSPDGGVEAEFACDASYQSYPDRLHGGIVALLLDAAMTHCLFARDLHGLTARLTIRYRGKVDIGTPGVVRARLVRTAHRMYDLSAEFVQAGVVRAEAEARFASRPRFEE